MRLIDTSTLALVTRRDNDLPPYAILSHTWGKDEEELTFEDIKQLMAYQSVYSSWLGRSIRQKAGFSKVRDSAAQAKADGYGYIWIDTCCIDKSSSAELSEAINSMYRYYQQSSVCYAYLVDVKVASATDELEEVLRQSRWFTRGWTLQELIAPPNVGFYDRDWRLIGTKRGEISSPDIPSNTSLDVVPLLARITGIPERALGKNGLVTLSDFSTAQRMSWASRRETTRIEDIAYCLMGIFNINMPLLYGEGDRAFLRLQEEILKDSMDHSIFAWKCPESDSLRYMKCGLLALSPSFFAYSGHIVTYEDSHVIETPYSMTNIGLHIQFESFSSSRAGRMYAHPYETAKQKEIPYDTSSLFAILKCQESCIGFSAAVTVLLWSLGDGQYARINPHIVYIIPRVGYHTDLTYMFVKQRPRQTSNMTLHFISDLEPMKLLATHPKMTHNKLQFDMSTQQPLAVVQLCNAINGTTFELYIGWSIKEWAVFSPQRPCWCILKDSDLHLSPEAAFGQFLEITTPQEIENFTYRYLHKGIVAEVTRNSANVIVSISLLHWGERRKIRTVRYPEWRSSGERGLANLTKVSSDSGSNTIIQEYKKLYQPCASKSWRVGIDRLSGRRFQRSANGPIYTGPRHNTALTIGVNIADISFETRFEGSVEESIYHQQSARLFIEACIQNDTTVISKILNSNATEPWKEIETSVSCAESQMHRKWLAIFDGFRPLHWAVASGSVEATRLLCEHNVNYGCSTTYGLTPLNIAFMAGNMDIIQFLLGLRDKLRIPSPVVDGVMHLAAAYVTSGDVENVLAKIRDRAEPRDFGWEYTKTRDQNHNRLQETPLHRAAAMGNVATAGALLHLDGQLDVNAPDLQGRNPLWHAAASGSTEIVQLLARHGADPNTRDQWGRTSLHAACLDAYSLTVEALLQAGAKPSYPAVQMACLADDLDILDAILHPGVRNDVNTTMALHIAAANGNLNCVKALCAFGCDWSVVDVAIYKWRKPLKYWGGGSVHVLYG